MSHSGEPAPISSINEDEIIDYLHLNYLNKSDAVRVLRRAFKSLHDTGGYPKYHRKYIGAFGDIWYCKNPEYRKAKICKI